MQPKKTNNGEEQAKGRVLDTREKESLISMIAILYIEDQSLLNEEQISDAKSSLKALFLSTAGEENMLRKLIQILRTNKALNQTFSDMSNILTGISKSTVSVRQKVDTLKQGLKGMEISAEENADFVGPFLNFSGEFIKKVEQFERAMHNYRDVKEKEARYAHMFRIAKEARARLKEKIGGEHKAEGDTVSMIRKKVIRTFDYGETESNLNYSQKEAKNTKIEIEQLLAEFKIMCHFAMNPDLREVPESGALVEKPAYEDVFTLYKEAMKRHPRLNILKNSIQELFRLYQHSFGMFGLDFEKFNKTISPMTEDTEAYFHAKVEDEDIRTKREKLIKIEGLIAFLEHAVILLNSKIEFVYAKFSQAITDTITSDDKKWSGISEDLLRMKVMAEAELRTRLG